MTVVRKCDSPNEVCQLVGRCDHRGEMSGVLERGDSCQKVKQSSGRCERY